MARWDPNARERLGQAAMELYRERGFDETSVQDIAARAGLTERTFFRHFTDKREVLFGGSEALQEMLAGGIAATPASMAPLDSVAASLVASSPFFEERRDFAKARHAIISVHPALMERELIKMATLAVAIAGALHARGVPDPAATLAADAGIAIFRLSFRRWLDDEKKRDLAHHVREALGELKAVAAGESGRPNPKKRVAARTKRTAPPQRRRPAVR